jgi:hypothetical protein
MARVAAAEECILPARSRRTLMRLKPSPASQMPVQFSAGSGEELHDR